MSSKVYFNYGSKISSKEVSEAIGLIPGPGPICGFGSANINGNNLDIYPFGYGDTGSANITSFDPLRYQIRDNIYSHKLSCKTDSDPTDYNVNFCFVNKDGILYRSGSQVLHTPIEGVNNKETREVLLFAEHNYVEEAVQNQPILRAFWNDSSERFYDLYKKSQDIYYPTARDKRKASIDSSKDPYSSGEVTYKSLIETVESVCEVYRTNQKNMVFLGVYGEGFDLMNNNKREDFAIIPYLGKYPATINYNQRIHSYITESILRLENFIGYIKIDSSTKKDGSAFTSIVEYLEYLMDEKIKILREDINKLGLVQGSIILFDGEVIPEGWEEYTKASGRVVIGYTEGGINLDTSDDSNRRELTTVGSIFNPIPGNGIYTIKIEGKDLPYHCHGIGLHKGKQDNSSDRTKLVVCNYQDRDRSISGNWSHDDGKDYHLVNGIQEGTVVTSPNLTNPVDFTTVTTKNTMIIDKLPPCITLRYIRKKATK